jgi:sugar-specific transcriptional regulator TrmB
VQEQCVEDIIELGFSRIEAEIFVFLVQRPSATGYQIAKALGRPNSNIYRALDTLQTKGAVLMAGGDKRLYRAVAIEELAGQITRRVEERGQRAVTNITALSERESDDRIYSLTAVDQMYTRCRRMLEECREVAFLDLSPLPLRALRPEIEAAAARGARVAVQVYDPVEIPGVEVVLHPRTAQVREHLPLQAVVVIVDGVQCLLGASDDRGQRVYSCLWTESVFLSYVLLGYMHSELTLNHITPGLHQGVSTAGLKDAFESWRGLFPLVGAPAYDIMWEKFRSVDSSPADKE